MAFRNSGRATAGAVPAACALGSPAGSPISIYFLAARQPPKMIENPRQTSAYHYPPKFGRHSPIFSRACVWGEPRQRPICSSPARRASSAMKPSIAAMLAHRPARPWPTSARCWTKRIAWSVRAPLLARQTQAQSVCAQAGGFAGDRRPRSRGRLSPRPISCICRPTFAARICWWKSKPSASRRRARKARCESRATFTQKV